MRAALPYLEEFHQQTFVIQISGDLLEIHDSRVIEDLALLQQVGIRIVIVHGAEAQIHKLLAAKGHDYQTEDSILVAEEAHLPLIEQAISSANWLLLTKLRSCGRQLQPFSGHFLFAEKKLFPEILVSTLLEVFAGLTWKPSTRLFQTLNFQFYHLFHLEKRDDCGF